MKTAFVFPGQGSQAVGMGRAWADQFPAARAVFQAVDDALDQPLLTLMTDGPAEELNLTENTQPALMAVSMAILAVLLEHKRARIDSLCQCLAGHSLGEYTALTAANAFDLSVAARLLKTRGRAMQKAVPVGVGAMAAILGLDLPDVQKLTADINRDISGDLIVDPANDNSAGQVVISGHEQAVAVAIERASAYGAKRAVRLPVSAPFHCRLMAPAAQAMSYALADTTIRIPVVPVVSNVTATTETDPAKIRRLLVEQITGMVRWRESVEWMAESGITTIVEIGSGKVLTGLIKRIAPDIKTLALNEPADLEPVLAAL